MQQCDNLINITSAKTACSQRKLKVEVLFRTENDCAHHVKTVLSYLSEEREGDTELRCSLRLLRVTEGLVQYWAGQWLSWLYSNLSLSYVSLGREPHPERTGLEDTLHWTNIITIRALSGNEKDCFEWYCSSATNNSKSILCFSLFAPERVKDYREKLNFAWHIHGVDLQRNVGLVPKSLFSLSLLRYTYWVSSPLKKWHLTSAHAVLNATSFMCLLDIFSSLLYRSEREVTF